MSKKVKKTTKMRLSVFGTISLVIVFYFGFILFFHLYTIYDLSNEKKQLEEKYKNLQEEADELQIEINKLSNPEYLARYAREKYSYSKEGEYVIKMNDTKESISNLDEKLNINYFIIGFSGVIFLIFVYIIIRSRKKEI